MDPIIGAFICFLFACLAYVLGAVGNLNAAMVVVGLGFYFAVMFLIGLVGERRIRAKEPVYCYSAKLLRVVDADTLCLMVDLGFSTHVETTVRLDGIDAPEIGTPEGKAARDYLVVLLPAQFVIRTRKDRREKFGRMLAVIELPDGTTANQQMLAAGHAKEYAGGTRAK